MGPGKATELMRLHFQAWASLSMKRELHTLDPEWHPGGSSLARGPCGEVPSKVRPGRRSWVQARPFHQGSEQVPHLS